MEILLWLVPAAAATGVAMLVAGYVGRERDTDDDAVARPAPHAELTWDPDEFVSRARTSARASREGVEQSAGDQPAAESEQAPAPRRTA